MKVLYSLCLLLIVPRVVQLQLCCFQAGGGGAAAAAAAAAAMMMMSGGGNRNNRMGGSISDFVNALELSGDLSVEQAAFIRQRYPDNNDDRSLGGNIFVPRNSTLPKNRIRIGPLMDEKLSDPLSLQIEVMQYLNEQEKLGLLTPQTKSYVSTLIQGIPSSSAPKQYKAADANYDSRNGNGAVQFLGRIHPSTSSNIDNPQQEWHYLGIWGYAIGSREYALICHSDGLHIVDVTRPSKAFRVQFIPMSYAIYWRDVETYYDATSATTYAYVAGQDGANLFVIDLSPLSGSTPHRSDTAKCPFIDRGYTNYGHTLTVRGDLLFLNSAGTKKLGCQILDLKANPWNPPLFTNSYHSLQHDSFRDCHDSVARVVSIPDMGPRNVLYSADGYSGRYRMVDITDIRSGASPVVLGETPAVIQRIYAHSVALTEDNHYLFAFEEDNIYDILVFDVLDPSNITLLGNFGFSEQTSEYNGLVHNGHIRGNYLFVAYYEAGFRVFDISDPTHPVEIGKYETFLDPDGGGVTVPPDPLDQRIYRGAWNLYPWLPSGNILVSDTEHGLFVFNLDLPETTHPSRTPSLEPSGTPETLKPSFSPSVAPSSIPSLEPSGTPETLNPSFFPSVASSSVPSLEPSGTPETLNPSTLPSVAPSSIPSTTYEPSLRPSSTLPEQPTNPFRACFSGKSLVEIQDVGLVPMERLHVGDMVNVGLNQYEPVYAFGHYAPLAMATFVELKTNVSALKISADHLIYSTEAQGYIPASRIQQGDKLTHGSTGDDSIVVISVRIVNTQEGVFAPFTPSGTIVVNGILASSFVSLVRDQDQLTIAGIDFSVQWLSHSFEFPHRFLCHHFLGAIPPRWCSNEQYMADGISMWVSIPLKFSRWLLEQSCILRHTTLSFIVLIFFLFCTLETCLQLSTSVLSLFLIAVFYLIYLHLYVRLCCLTIRQGKSH